MTYARKNEMQKEDVRNLTLALKGSGIGLAGVDLRLVSYDKG